MRDTDRDLDPVVLAKLARLDRGPGLAGQHRADVDERDERSTGRDDPAVELASKS